MISQKSKVFIFFLFILANCCSLFGGEGLEYSISPQMVDGKQTLLVNLKFQGNHSGETEIVLPSSWAGQNELYAEIHQLESLSEQYSIEETEQPQLKIIHHLPHEMIEIRYQVVPRERQEIEWFYRPQIDHSHFFFFGQCFFIIPKIDDQQDISILLEWKGFPDEWSLANSFGTQQRKQQFQLSISTFLDAVYIGGDFQILKCGNDSAPIFIAIRGKWSFSHKRLTDLIEKVITSHREFWHDHAFPYYLITVLPIGGDHHMGGTGLFNSFSIFSGDLYEENDEDWKWLAWLLSHEHFHTWNGTKMIPNSPEGSLAWFTEGFTEYYAMKLNLRTQLIDLNDYVEHINTIMYDYYVSSAHHEPNRKIETDFWTNWDVQRLPYVRGFLFALHWNQKIHEISDGQSSLDDFMLALFRHTQEKQGLFSLEDIEQVASQFLPLDSVEEEINNYIVNGHTLVPKNEYQGKYFIKWIDDIGFNQHQTLIKGKIVGVKEASKAFEAGLRNEQQYLTYDHSRDRISIDVIDQSGNRKSISWLIDPTARLFPQYLLQEILK